MSDEKLQQITEKRLSYRFKGGRDYVHGTDIYTSIIETLSVSGEGPKAALHDIKLSIRKPSTHHCLLTVRSLEHEDKRPELAVVDFTFKQDNKPYKGWLMETSDEVSSKYDYSEQSCIDASMLHNASVISTGRLQTSTIEQLVALTKHLHVSEFPDLTGKWFFSRLDVLSPLPAIANKSIKVTLEKKLGNRLTQSIVSIDESPYGHIYFSLVPQ